MCFHFGFSQQMIILKWVNYYFVLNLSTSMQKIYLNDFLFFEQQHKITKTLWNYCWQQKQIVFLKIYMKKLRYQWLRKMNMTKLQKCFLLDKNAMTQLKKISLLIKYRIEGICQKLRFIFIFNKFKSYDIYSSNSNAIVTSKYHIEMLTFCKVLTWFFDTFFDQCLQNCLSCILLRYKLFLIKIITIKFFNICSLRSLSSFINQLFIIYFVCHLFDLLFIRFIIHFVYSV